MPRLDVARERARGPRAAEPEPARDRRATRRAAPSRGSPPRQVTLKRTERLPEPGSVNVGRASGGGARSAPASGSRSAPAKASGSGSGSRWPAASASGGRRRPRTPSGRGTGRRSCRAGVTRTNRTPRGAGGRRDLVHPVCVAERQRDALAAGVHGRPPSSVDVSIANAAVAEVGVAAARLGRVDAEPRRRSPPAAASRPSRWPCSRRVDQPVRGALVDAACGPAAERARTALSPAPTSLAPPSATPSCAAAPTSSVVGRVRGDGHRPDQPVVARRP